MNRRPPRRTLTRSGPLWALILAGPLLPAPARADVAVGGEYLLVTRDLDLGTAEAEIDDGQAVAAFLGFDIGNSMVYLKFSRETADVPASRGWTYERTEVAAEWNWNESWSKDRYFNTALGVFVTDYHAAPGLEAEFVGVSAGAGFTRFLGRNVFFNARARLRLAAADEEELLASPETEETSFGGFDAQAGLGFQLGRQSAWSLQVGYKLHRMNPA